MSPNPFNAQSLAKLEDLNHVQKQLREDDIESYLKRVAHVEVYKQIRNHIFNLSNEFDIRITELNDNLNSPALSLAQKQEIQNEIELMTIRAEREAKEIYHAYVAIRNIMNEEYLEEALSVEKYLDISKKTRAIFPIK